MSNATQPDLEAIPFRIRIGVTGHRKLPDEASLTALLVHAVDRVFENSLDEKTRNELSRAKAENSPPIGYEVISALAEGADRLVARVALSRYDPSQSTGSIEMATRRGPKGLARWTANSDCESRGGTALQRRCFWLPRKVTTCPRRAATKRWKLKSSAGCVSSVAGEFVAITRQAQL